MNFSVRLYFLVLFLFLSTNSEGKYCSSKRNSALSSHENYLSFTAQEWAEPHFLDPGNDIVDFGEYTNPYQNIEMDEEVEPNITIAYLNYLGKLNVCDCHITYRLDLQETKSISYPPKCRTGRFNFMIF